MGQVVSVQLFTGAHCLGASCLWSEMSVILVSVCHLLKCSTGSMWLLVFSDNTCDFILGFIAFAFNHLLIIMKPN